MTEKIYLRPLTPEDVTPNYVNWLNDPRVYKYLGIRHRQRDYSADDIRSFLESCTELRRFHWGIFLDGRHIGNVSCSQWSLENCWIDISYILGETDAWGQGVATAAVGAAINYLFFFHHFNRVQAHAVLENVASIRVMEKLGMLRDGILREYAYFPEENYFADEVIYSVLKKEWRPNPGIIESVDICPMAWEDPKAR